MFVYLHNVECVQCKVNNMLIYMLISFVQMVGSEAAYSASSANNVIRLMVDEDEDDGKSANSRDTNSLMGLIMSGKGVSSTSSSSSSTATNNVVVTAKPNKMNEEQQRPATATPKPPTTSLNDIFISVKTTKQNHDNRLELILNTWQQLAKQQVSFFSTIFF